MKERQIKNVAACTQIIREKNVEAYIT